MTAAIIANLEKMLGGPRDGALLRYSLGSELLKSGDASGAAQRFREAVERDANYSAAWKMLGKALALWQDLAERGAIELDRVPRAQRAASELAATCASERNP